MSPESLEPPAPICEACWIKQNVEWEPESMDNRGAILMRLKGVPVPLRNHSNTVETCSECGALTVAGMYNLREEQISFPENGIL